MIVNTTNLRSLYVAFSAAFAEGLGQAQSQYQELATTVPSTTASNEYGWLGAFPSLREWLGDRVVHGIRAHGYTIRNRSYELTVGVSRTDIEDDNIGAYTPLMRELGRSVGAQPDQLVYGAIKAGTSELCYDGQPFFDADHPVLDASGQTVSQSNWDDGDGTGTPWYLLDTSRALRPIIYQSRKAPRLVAKTSDTDDNVFDRDEYVYGVDCRRNVGYGFWQLAYGSRQPLTEANLIAAHAVMTERMGDHGRPLGITPTLLVVRPSLKFAAAKLVSAATLANGAENVLKGAVQVHDTPWII